MCPSRIRPGQAASCPIPSLDCYAGHAGELCHRAGVASTIWLLGSDRRPHWPCLLRELDCWRHTYRPVIDGLWLAAMWLVGYSRHVYRYCLISFRGCTVVIVYVNKLLWMWFILASERLPWLSVTVGYGVVFLSWGSLLSGEVIIIISKSIDLLLLLATQYRINTGLWEIVTLCTKGGLFQRFEFRSNTIRCLSSQFLFSSAVVFLSMPGPVVDFLLKTLLR